MGETVETQRLSHARRRRPLGRLAARSALKRFARDTRGATAIEYGLILCLICTGLVVIVGSVADKNEASYNSVAEAIDGAI